MNSGPSFTLKRPWEVEVTATPHGHLRHESAPSNQLNAGPYGRDISGWHYGPYDASSQPWSLRTPPESASLHESHAKRTRLEQGDRDSLGQAHSAQIKTWPSDQVVLRHTHRPHASALGPVLSLGYHPATPSTPQGRSPPGLGRALPHPVPALPVLPSPISLAGTSVPMQPPVPALPPLAAPIAPLSSGTNSGPVPSQFPELQRQVADTDVHLKRLQVAYDDLQKEYERAKSRLATYDRKSKTADQELAMLHEEKFSLQDRVISLEKELEDTKRQKTEAQELHTREGAQWRRIISLSDTLQKQHSDQAEKWNRERGAMNSKIESLEDQVRKLKISSTAGSAESGSQEGGDDDSSVSRGDGNPSLFLTREIHRVRVQEEQARQRLREYQAGSQELKDLLWRVKVVMERMEGSQHPGQEVGMVP